MKHLIAYEGCAGISLGVMLEEYAELFAPWINERVGIEGTLQRPPYAIESGREWIRELGKSKGKDEVFAILLKDTDSPGGYRYIGHTGIHRIEWPRTRGTATTGSMIVLSDARGKGHGTEAKLLLLRHAFHIVGLRKIHSAVKGWNAASLGHLVKCGYSVTGRELEADWHDGRFVDEIRLSVFRKDFDPLWEKYSRTRTLPRLTQRQRAFVKKETSN